MARRKGKVTKIGKSKYSFYILLDGDQFYFNTKYDPKCGVGDVVGIEYEGKGDTRGQVKNVKIFEDAGGPKGFQQGSFGGGGKSYSAADSTDRNTSIVYQSSRKDALVLAGLILQVDGIAVPKAKDKARVVVEELVDELTLRLFKEALDPSNALKGAKGAEDDAAGGDDWEGDAEEAKSEGSSEDWDDEDWS